MSDKRREVVEIERKAHLATVNYSENGFTKLVDLRIYPSKLVAPNDKIHPMPFPGLNIDSLPFFSVIAATAKGRSLIHDWVFENRAIYSTELANLNADVELLDAHRTVAGEICDKVKVLPFFEKYLKCGYYPMYRDVSSQFQERLVAIVNNVLDVDLPSVEDVTTATVRKAKKMLMVLARDCPQQPNMSELYRELETNRNLGLKLLAALERAELFATVESGSLKLKRLSRPGKVFLGDTNLMHALVPMPDIGAVRETFFANQLASAGHVVEYAGFKKGDFRIDGDIVVEVGGQDKGFSQLAGQENAYVAADSIESAYMRKIPLWAFGFLY